jgi:hypothetical protein
MAHRIPWIGGGTTSRLSRPLGLRPWRPCDVLEPDRGVTVLVATGRGPCRAGWPLQWRETCGLPDRSPSPAATSTCLMGVGWISSAWIDIGGRRGVERRSADVSCPKSTYVG